MKNSITLSQAIAGYLINLSARHLSQNTVNDYTHTLNKFCRVIGSDVPISTIGINQINKFFAIQTNLSNKTLSNYHSTLNTFFEWMITSQLVKENPIKFIQRAKPERRVVDPVPVEEIKKLLDAVTYSKSYSRSGKRTCRNKLAGHEKNVAIILFFLDNGVRVSELCNLRMKDLDLKQQRAFINGKGAKERFVPFSPRTKPGYLEISHETPGNLPGGLCFHHGEQSPTPERIHTEDA